MTNNTKLSLYKILLPSTTWVHITPSEFDMIMDWLTRHSYRTEKRTGFDNLFDTFLWFPVHDGDGVWVPLGHITRLQKEIDARFPRHRLGEFDGAICSLLSVSRNHLSGAEILQIKVRQVREGSI